MKIKKTTLLKKLRYRRKQWDATIGRIVKDDLEEEMITNEWSVKDVINHITWYEKELLVALENRSIVESEFWTTPVDDRNEMIFNKTQDKTLHQVLEISKTVFDDLINKIEKMSDEELNSEDFIKRKSAKRITHDFIGGISFWHYEDHEDALIDHFDLEYGY